MATPPPQFPYILNGWPLEIHLLWVLEWLCENSILGCFQHWTVGEIGFWHAFYLYVACFLLLQHFLCHVFIDAWCVICFGIDIQRCLDSMGKWSYCTDEKTTIFESPGLDTFEHKGSACNYTRTNFVYHSADH
jgi:hypothetical protein